MEGGCRLGGGRGLCPVREAAFFFQWHFDVKCGARAAARALHRDAPVLRIHQTLGDGKTETETAETVALLMVFLREGIEDFFNHRRVDADAGIPDLDQKRAGIFLRIAGAHAHGATGRGEFHRVLQHVPENLLHPHCIRLDGMLLRGEVHFDIDFPLARLGFYDFVGLAQRGMGIQRADIEAHLSAGDAREVEQVVDEPRFERDRFHDDIEVRADFPGQIGIPRKLRGKQQRGGEGSAEFMRERGQEIILRAGGLLGAEFRGFRAHTVGLRTVVKHFRFRLALAQVFLHLARIRDVVRRGYQPGGMPFLVQDRRHGDVPPFHDARGRGALGLETAMLASQGGLQRSADIRLGFIGPERNPLLAAVLREIVDLKHAQAGGIHFEDAPSGVEDMDAIPGAIEDGVVESHALAQRRGGFLVRGHLRLQHLFPLLGNRPPLGFAQQGIAERGSETHRKDADKCKKQEPHGLMQILGNNLKMRPCKKKTIRNQRQRHGDQSRYPAPHIRAGHDRYDEEEKRPRFADIRRYGKPQAHDQCRCKEREKQPEPQWFHTLHTADKIPTYRLP